LFGSAYPAGQAIISATCYRQPPRDLQTLMLMPGSRTWKAEEGCYNVFAFHSNENPPQVPGYECSCFSSVDDVEAVVGTDPWWIEHMNITPLANFPSTTLTPSCSKQFPIHTSIAVASGLSATSSFQLNANFVFERFVDQNESDLLVLATPSAEYDPIVLECYSHALSLMPPGVTFNENPFGEWFADVIDRVADVLSYIPHPIFQGLSAAGKGAVGLYRASNGNVQVIKSKAPKDNEKAVYNNKLLKAGVRTTMHGKKVSGPLTPGAFYAVERRRAKKAVKGGTFGGHKKKTPLLRDGNGRKIGNRVGLEAAKLNRIQR